MLLQPTGAEATGGMEFGLSEKSPILQNLMCSGNEHNITQCPGYSLTDVNADFCPNSNHQAGFRCVAGINEYESVVGGDREGNQGVSISKDLLKWPGGGGGGGSKIFI